MTPEFRLYSGNVNGQLAPVYRVRRGNGKHFLTTNSEGEGAGAVQFVLGYIALSPQTVPTADGCYPSAVGRVYSTTGDYHLHPPAIERPYTPDHVRREDGNLGYTCRSARHSEQADVQVYGGYNPGTQAWLHSTNLDELTTHGFTTRLGRYFSAYSTSDSGASVAIYRAVRPNGKHFLTSNPQEPHGVIDVQIGYLGSSDNPPEGGCDAGSRSLRTANAYYNKWHDFHYYASTGGGLFSEIPFNYGYDYSGPLGVYCSSETSSNSF